jgi:leucyl-tRNA synthetase
MSYDHKSVDPKWQKKWEDAGIFHAEEKSKKESFYVLVEFPFPSGAGLHVGHPRSYTALDVIARKKRMEGKNVLYPMGWDAFGLPAENYALKTGIHPSVITKENIATFRRQLQSIGFSFDWSREIDTTDPKYYRWTQWQFLQFFKAGLAYKAKATINWCPKDKIGLANEEVVGGCCERCGTAVEKKEKEQWMIAITKYADRLIDDLKDVDYLPKIKKQQEDWIGRSEGAEISFPLLFKEGARGRSAEETAKLNANRGPNGEKAAIPVFTTRPDTINGATFLVLAPEHPWVTLATDEKHDVLENKDEVAKYVASVKQKTDIDRTNDDKEKTGVELKGVKAINPVSGEEIPLFVADYVLPQYGTGAIMAVPAHDERDFGFAKKFNLPVKQVVAPYIRMTGIAEPREDKETVSRNVVTALIKNPVTDEYLLLKQADGQYGFVGGGVEEGENIEAAALREITEETGYSQVVVKDFLPIVYGHGYKPKKDINCFDPDNVVVAELKDGTRGDMSEEDRSLHEVIWVSADQVLQTLTKDHHKEMWKRYLSGDRCIAEEGIAINSGEFDGQTTAEVKELVLKLLEEKGTGKKKTTYKLRDWVFSRQRYWGEPIPLIHCDHCASIPPDKGGAEGGWVAVPDDQLPVLLPQVEKYEPTDNGESPLASISEFVNTTCPTCGGAAKRETDTMPNWAGSSWYFLRYTDPHNDEAFASPKALKNWMPVDLYNGGMEHTTLHLLYSRFWNKFLFDQGLVPTSEPYARRHSHGLIMAEDGTKMSKSVGNVVNPDDIVNEYGADALRTYILFMGPFEEHVPWSTNGLIGVRRFLDKIVRLSEKTDVTTDITKALHKTIKKVTNDIEAFKFNTAVSTLMSFVNEVQEKGGMDKEAFSIFLRLLVPFAPHITNELWERMGNEGFAEGAAWPTYDEALLVDDEMVISVQVNGKMRSTLTVPTGMEEATLVEMAKNDENVKKFLTTEPKKTIVVKGKIVNFVI